jgi:type II secretory ATPase GspE/PulE/Tfp pilus assembly ATPase PilB-like protein
MPDLSPPPLSLQPLESAATASEARRAFVWPTPDLAGYPAPSERAAGQICELEGNNGETTTGRLMRMDPAGGVVMLVVPPARGVHIVRFSQFRCLRLLAPLAPTPDPAGTAPTALTANRPALPFSVAYKDSPVWKGTTLGHQEESYGLFLFEPLNSAGNVQRVFVPRAAYNHAEIGLRLGETLVQNSAATPAQVDAALAEQQVLRNRKLGDLMLVRQIITPEELSAAIDQQARMPMVRIGEALTALGFITEAQLEDALVQQRRDRSTPLGELLVRSGVVSRTDLQTALARKMGYPLVDVTNFPADAESVLRLPYPVAIRLPALPLMMRAGRMVVALEDPTNRRAIDELEFAAQCKVVPVLARSGVLPTAIEQAYSSWRAGAGAGAGAGGSGVARSADSGMDYELADASKLLASMEQVDTAPAQAEDDPIEQSDNSLVRLINSVISEAQSQGISDIHIESQPGRDKVRIRFRKDGQMRPYLELPHTYRSALIARLKIMCDLDISERRKPQDGKITFSKFVQGSQLELRVATIPTSAGLEDAVLRLLASSKPIPLENLNLSPSNYKRFREVIERPYGMLLCVGPTGSGKTTTLHSALSCINTPERKIWTAEDPVEITQAGLRQVQVNPRIEWTFARALRSFLRADPDVIMVGEIRDLETAQVAIESSLTGHLVLSTLHTNSAPETVTRLLDMGMDPFNFADALLGVLAQRLVRRQCTKCRVSRDATPEEEEELLRDYLHVMQDVDNAPSHEDVLADWRKRFSSEGSQGRLALYKSVGCDHCGGTGFRGRAGIHELMMMSRQLRHLIQIGTRADDLQKQALADGMRTLRQDGIEKVLAGVTTIEEVRANS